VGKSAQRLASAGASRLPGADAELGLVIIDEVGMIQPTRPLDDPARERGEVARSLKLLARELAVPVVALSRLPQPGRVIAGRCLPISPKGSSKPPAWSCCCIVRSWMIRGRRGAVRWTSLWLSIRPDRPTW
jgi:hypothetical protein